MSDSRKRVAIYTRVNTSDQKTDNHVRDLRLVAERRGWDVVEIYSDEGISGAKGRDKRPDLDRLLDEARRRKFDVVMAWAIDRLGRSLIDLLGTIQHLEASGVDLYLDKQGIDTTTPMGKLLFQVTGAFAEFERTIIKDRIKAGMARINAELARQREKNPEQRATARRRPRHACNGRRDHQDREGRGCWRRGRPQVEAGDGHARSCCRHRTSRPDASGIDAR